LNATEVAICNATCRLFEVENPENDTSPDYPRAFTNLELLSWQHLSDVFLRAQKRQEGANRITRINLRYVRTFVYGIPILAVVVTLRSVT
jgi:hypothetical protein